MRSPWWAKLAAPRGGWSEKASFWPNRALWSRGLLPRPILPGEREGGKAVREPWPGGREARVLFIRTWASKRTLELLPVFLSSRSCSALCHFTKMCGLNEYLCELAPLFRYSEIATNRCRLMSYRLTNLTAGTVECLSACILNTFHGLTHLCIITTLWSSYLYQLHLIFEKNGTQKDSVTYPVSLS